MEHNEMQLALPNRTMTQHFCNQSVVPLTPSTTVDRHHNARSFDIDADDAWDDNFDSLRRRRFNLDKYDPSMDVPGQIWIDLFEMVTEGLTDNKRVPLLATYLKNDGLRWFGQFIAPHRQFLSWTETKQLFKDKFAKDDVKPIVAAKDRILTNDEKVQTYFDDKLRLLELSRLPTDGMIDLLTDGLSDNMRSMVISRDPRTLAEWLRCTQLFESTKPKQPEPVHLIEAGPQSTNSRSSRKDEELPKDPCPRCLRQKGETNHHWMKKCPLPRIVPLTTAGNLNANSGPSQA